MKKTVIITGASGNLGTAAVQKMLTDGYRVVAVSNTRNEFGFAEDEENFEHYAVDLTRETDTQAFVEDVIKRCKTIHAVFLLAGGFALGDIHATGSEDLKKMYALNFETAYYTVRPIFSHMLDSGYGRIVFVGARPSLVGEYGKNMIAYALSKSLLFKLSEFLNESAKGTNVVSSIIVPSTIDTPPNRQAMPQANFESWVKAEQIAAVLAFICSAEGESIREPVYKLYNNA